MIVGALTFTVNVALLLVTEPVLFEMTTEYEPASVAAVELII